MFSKSFGDTSEKNLVGHRLPRRPVLRVVAAPLAPPKHFQSNENLRDNASKSQNLLRGNESARTDWNNNNTTTDEVRFTQPREPRPPPGWLLFFLTVEARSFPTSSPQRRAFGWHGPSPQRAGIRSSLFCCVTNREAPHPCRPQSSMEQVRAFVTTE